MSSTGIINANFNDLETDNIDGNNSLFINKVNIIDLINDLSENVFEKIFNVSGNIYNNIFDLSENINNTSNIFDLSGNTNNYINDSSENPFLKI